MKSRAQHSMTLHEPFFISARLMAAVRVGELIISIEPTARTDNRGATVWAYAVDGAEGVELAEGDDLAGWGDHVEMMETLLAFMSACGESYDYAMHTSRERGITIAQALEDIDNGELFPLACAEECYRLNDELSMMAEDLREQIETGKGE